MMETVQTGKTDPTALSPVSERSRLKVRAMNRAAGKRAAEPLSAGAVVERALDIQTESFSQ